MIEISIQEDDIEDAWSLHSIKNKVHSKIVSKMDKKNRSERVIIETENMQLDYSPLIEDGTGIKNLKMFLQSLFTHPVYIVIILCVCH